MIETMKAGLVRLTKLSLLALVLLGLINLSRPLPSVQPVVNYAYASPPPAAGLRLPTGGQSAVAADGFGVLAGSPRQAPRPMASIAKLVTALTVLKQKPLEAGESGPSIKMRTQDEAYYRHHVARNGSVVRVAAGAKLSQYQALQALLIPSGNNIADSLADWAFGSIPAYLAAANGYVQSLGMADTRIADASGLSAQTTSTANDLIKLALAVLNEPAVMAIVKQKTATVPVHGLINNTNWLLGQNGVTGLKTGHTEQAGGCFLLAARQRIGGRVINIVSARLGAPTVATAISQSNGLLANAAAGFKSHKVAARGQAIGYYDLPWGGRVEVIANQALSVTKWDGHELKPEVVAGRLPVPAAAGQKIGKIKVVSGGRLAEADLVIKNRVTTPSIAWRVFR